MNFHYFFGLFSVLEKQKEGQNMPQLKHTFVCLALFISIISPFTHASERVQHDEVLQSKHLNEKRTAVVQLPKSYSSNPQSTYPVIYVLDGKGHLPLLSSIMSKLHSADAAPESILVAIENTDRLRDLTPTVNHDPRGPVGGGGGEKFLDYIEMELIPHISKKYRTHNFKIFAGASIGGLLAIHSLQSRPHLFQAHLAFSPAVWWGDHTTAKKTKAFFSNVKTLDNYLYMNIGEEGGLMRAVYDDLASFLHSQKPENFKLVTNEFNNVPHGLTFSAGLFHALQNLFLPMRMPNRELKDGLESLHNYYNQLSIQRGKKISPPEWVLRELGYHLMNQKELSTALLLFKYNVQLHPGSAQAYNGLAYIFERKGLYNESLKQVNLALNLAQKGDDGYHFFIERRDRLTSLLEQSKHQQ